MRDELWCRTYSEFAFDFIVGVEDCQAWARNGDTISAIRGGGESGSYILTVVE